MTLKTISLLPAVILITCLTVCQAEQGGCPSDWHEVNGRCYRFIKPYSGKKTFQAAETICNGMMVTCSGQSKTGQLAWIPCPVIQNELAQLASTAGLDEDYYINMRVDSDCRESWTSGNSGESVHYTAWASGQRYVGNTRGVMSFSNGGNGEWKAVSADTLANYVCMLPCVTDTFN
ncbi:hypothetical protein HOLleu_12212 [Holothuria leucospilota]|uniref:C-type lectin domain-containing protein n=1 Tax=Holothuria leucospilota TaxID=206669 RepID=A0A9Q1CB93_HOLLE|nr:hypothetical protein HOLleu_12212 [Holothuria leucospilota]